MRLPHRLLCAMHAVTIYYGCLHAKLLIVMLLIWLCAKHSVDLGKIGLCFHCICSHIKSSCAQGFYMERKKQFLEWR